MQKLPSVFVWCGLLFLVLSVVFGWILGPYLIEDQVIRMAKIRNGTFLWDKWKNPTHEMYLRVYFFNVTNPAEVEEGAIPIFKEVGPYTFQETRFKENIVYHEQKDTISYTQPVTFHFRPDLSAPGLQLGDELTFINLPLVGASQKLHTYSSWIQFMMGSFLEQYEEQLFVTRKVSEMLFDGYYNEMVEELQNLTGENFFPNALVGVLVGRNNSDEGKFEVYTGINDYSKLGKIASYNGQTRLDVWPSEPCNMIHGSDGSVLPPLQTRKSVIHGFNHDVCRSFFITYVRDVEVDGVPGLRFEPPVEQYYGAKRNPDNKCFCPGAKEDFSNCFEDGVHSGAGCHRDGPITISNPHFLYAPFYLNKTKGLVPDKESHGLYAEFEPTSGLILRAARRMQVNVDLNPNSAVGGMKKVPKMQFPMLWVDESLILDKEIRSQLLTQLLVAQSLLGVGKWVCLGASLIFLVASILLNVVRARKRPYIYS